MADMHLTFAFFINNKNLYFCQNKFDIRRKGHTIRKYSNRVQTNHQPFKHLFRNLGASCPKCDNLGRPKIITRNQEDKIMVRVDDDSQEVHDVYLSEVDGIPGGPSGGQKPKLFSFNVVFEPAATQEDVLQYSGMKRLIEMALEGFSRSHTILSVNITSEQPTEGGVFISRSGKINFVDLAGSEMTKKTQSEGKTLEEANNINKSLMVLGGQSVVDMTYERSPSSSMRRHNTDISFTVSQVAPILSDEEDKILLSDGKNYINLDNLALHEDENIVYEELRSLTMTFKIPIATDQVEPLISKNESVFRFLSHGRN
ncbi:unnamed protein product [Diabrotica balteata]|uniref:Kinesin motor domain-containing protein n=1 Tax=Diabrotica balteata TaxID=107213 RepID=A0A9N9T4R5_DIABA|nr:unnamed protein product [Diabrotica balteata]